MKKRVLILCTGNSARSQMAEGLLRHDAGDTFDVESAGTKPGAVRPEAIKAMQEVGIDISGHRSKHVKELDGQSFDYLITVCDNAKGKLSGLHRGRTAAASQLRRSAAAHGGHGRRTYGYFSPGAR